MKLHEATKQLVAQFGKNIVTNTRLANLLADINGYEEYPAIIHNKYVASLWLTTRTLLLQKYSNKK